MADGLAPLTQAQLDKAIAWLKSQDKPPPPCPICGSNKWAVGQHLVQPLTMSSDGNVQVGGIGYPLIQVISEKCGFTMFVNAVIAGIVPTAKVEAAEEKQQAHGN